MCGWKKNNKNSMVPTVSEGLICTQKYEIDINNRNTHFCIENSNITSCGLISSAEKVLKHFNTDSFRIICKMSV